MQNNAGVIADLNLCGLAGCTNFNDSDLTFFPGAVYAVWTEVSAVSVPAAIWLFGSAILGMIGFNKRKARATA